MTTQGNLQIEHNPYQAILPLLTPLQLCPHMGPAPGLVLQAPLAPAVSWDALFLKVRVAEEEGNYSPIANVH